MWTRLPLLMCAVAAMPHDGILILNGTSTVHLYEPDTRDFHETNPSVTAYGRLVEGDILRLPGEDRKAISSGQLWDDRRYNYEIVAENERAFIEAGIQFWRENTCIDFREVSPGSGLPRVQFVAERGCWSSVGCMARFQSSRTQKLSIGNGCNGLGTVTHEIGHSLGFFHEQSRSDRDRYVSILWENIEASGKSNFERVSTTEHYGVPYDLSSVMHYGKLFFSRNGKPTILTLDPTRQGLIGQRVQPSFRDVSLMNRLYKCEELCPRRPACHNGGYVSADCRCHCPPGTSGADCGKVTGSYYPEPTCGGTVTTEGALTSPGWPGVYPAGVDCVWWIKPPAGRRAQVAFTKFDILFRVSNGCYFEYLEVRNAGVMGEAEQYCGTDLANKNLEARGPDGDMVLHFKAYRKHYAGTGFSAEVKFV
ncbi:blastula protease 10-like [Pollicipes pollicipes]|uniref:blastula protease 10-like n=1 Tax=Pollicipes pollicipes TaxID=41117 RepID=UPI0018859BB2|nr:blastula protease 10-like [Pollicipes pollicipes]